MLAAQFATVRCNYDGDWSALFREGARYAAAPQLAWERHRRFPDSMGYDGQLYHVVAHDPFLRGELARYVDAPRLRYRRVLVPLGAYVAALGRQDWVDVAYRAVVLLFVFLGAYWCAAGAGRLGRSPAWGLAFLLVPSVIVSADTLTVDVALAALTAGFAFYVTGASPRKLWLVLAAAALVRETGALLALVEAVGLALRRRMRSAVRVVLTLLPAAAWYTYVHARTPPYDYPNDYVPLRGLVSAWLHPAPVPAIGSGQVAEWWRVMLSQRPLMDRLALAGVVVAFAMALTWLRREPGNRLAAVAAALALLGTFVQRPDNWLHVYDYGRVYSPLLLLLALRGLERRSPWPLLPMALMWPRLGLELAMQAVGVLRAVLHAAGS